MRTIAPDDTLMAETPHARLMRDCLRSGALMDPRFERIVEAITVLYMVDPLTASPNDKEKRRAAFEKSARAAMEMVFDMARFLPEKEAKVIYDTTESLASIRSGRIK